MQLLHPTAVLGTQGSGEGWPKAEQRDSNKPRIGPATPQKPGLRSPKGASRELHSTLPTFALKTATLI